MMVRSVWATPAAREEFARFELLFAAFAYSEQGPQRSMGDMNFRLYDFPDGRALLIAERWGRVSLMTEEEVEAERRKVREQKEGGE